METKISFSAKKLKSFCRKHQVRELSLFGSFSGNTFHTGSDVDVLIRFLPDAEPTLVDLDEMRTALETLFRRNVDLVEAEALRNPFRRFSILKNRKRLYAA